MKTFYEWCNENGVHPGYYLDHEAIYNGGILSGLEHGKKLRVELCAAIRDLLLYFPDDQMKTARSILSRSE